MPATATAPPAAPTGAAVPALPPGPPQGRLAQTVALHRDPVGFLRAAQAAHGDVFTVRTTTTGPFVVVADPALAHGLPDRDPGLARAGAARRRLLPPASSRSTFGGDDEAHARARARVMPVFAPEAVAARRADIATIVDARIADWPRRRPFALLPALRRLADEVMVRTVLRIEDPQRAEALVRHVGRMLATPGNPPLPVPGPRDGLVGRVVGAEVARRRAPVFALLGAELAERRRAADARRDLLGLLLAAEPGRPDDELADELLPVLMAAQEPMAAALTWMLLHLARGDAPDAAARLAGGGERDVRAFADESLRVTPPALASLRELTEPVDVGGHHLPAGTVTAVPIPLVQRDPRRLPDPERFDPGRAAVPGAVVMPFGVGARRCLGEALAWEQIGAVLPAVAGRLRLRPAWPVAERAVLRATILVPVRGGLVLATDRRG